MDDSSGQNGDAHADTQNSLRQASSALEVAYRRIRQLRHSLLELAESMPPSDVQPAVPNPIPVGPPHEAILLSGTSTEDQEDGLVLDMARLRSSLPPSVMDRLEQFESEFLGDQPTDRSSEQFTLPPPAPSGGTTRQLPPSRNSPFNMNPPTASPSRNPVIHPRRSLLEFQLSRRRDANPDDPSTARGRHVAAREAGDALADTHLPQLERFLLSTTAVIARSLETVTNRLNQRSQTTDPIAFPRDPNHRQTGDDPRVRRGLEGTGTRGGRSPSVNATQISAPVSFFPPRQPPNRRWRTMIRPESLGRQASGPSAPSGQSTSSTRLSVLSNFSAVDNLSTPVTPLSRDRPILFEEPSSYVPSYPGDIPLEEDLEPSTVDRNYIVRRRMNADGEEFVHNLNVLWNDPIENHRHIRGPPRIDDTRPSSSRSSLEAPRRRRGWARLDADGNEISTDEEEELERVRAEHRVRRSLQRPIAFAYPQTDSAPEDVPVIPSGSSMISISGGALLSQARTLLRSMNALQPVTSAERDNIPFPTSSNPTEPSPVDIPAEDTPEMFGSSLPFVVDPLPMPLASMTPSCNAQREEHPPLRKVSRHASLAGR